MTISSYLFVQKRSAATTLRQPKEIGYYSKNKDEEFLVNDNSKLNFYYMPDSDLDRQLDLSGGIKKFKDATVAAIRDPCTLEGLLSTLGTYEKKKAKKVSADIITFRGIMRKLISAAFDSPKFNTVDLIILSFDGQLFIKEVQQAKPPGATTNSLEYRSYYSGYKFETLATISKPLPFVSRETLEKRPKKIVSNGEQFVSVVRSGVGNCKLVLGAEVDCIFDFKEDSSTNLKHYAELKCTKGVNSFADARNFEKKIFRTWLQCFLVGINRIIYGFRDDRFILKSAEEFTTSEIPVLLKTNSGPLANACMDAIKWYGALTEWLLATIPRENGSLEAKAFTLTFDNNHLKLNELAKDHPNYESVVNGDEVLTREFRDWRKSLANASTQGVNF
ncbi:LAMI_0D01706g1_1 [Lachancea mirantina]|uniref:Decapping nuclease n=1 Tax=Lachancea mirantina TaxID=1230905 RepID=A0A1G4J932_9SACH|nr:LAMI_0D01706g1_1 [Lachancea mirantina]